MIEKKGFTLIETVVAMVIAGIILGVIYYAFSTSIKILNAGNDILAATEVSKKIFNEFMLKKKNEIDFFDEYKEEEKFDEQWNYSFTIKRLLININDKFDINPQNQYKLLLTLKKENKIYNFEFYFEK